MKDDDGGKRGNRHQNQPALLHKAPDKNGTIGAGFLPQAEPSFVNFVNI